MGGGGGAVSAGASVGRSRGKFDLSLSKAIDYFKKVQRMYKEMWVDQNLNNDFFFFFFFFLKHDLLIIFR